MRIDQLEQTFEGSDADQWMRIDGGGPTYLHSYIVESDAETAHISHVEYHQSIAVLRDDIDVRIAWGFDPDHGEPRRRFNFADNFPDSTVSVELGDVFYRGALVQRYWLVSVDGGRSCLPMPSTRLRSGVDKVGPHVAEDYEYQVTRAEVAFARLVDSLDGNREFDSYLSQAGFRIVP